MNASEKSEESRKEVLEKMLTTQQVNQYPKAEGRMAPRLFLCQA